MGKRVSRTRWPVIRGISGISLLTTGRPKRTGHLCIMVISLPSTVAIGSVTVKSPALMSWTVPLMPTGMMILCMMDLSGAVPMICPWVTLSPFFTVGVKAYLILRSNPGAETPRLMKSPIVVISSGRGLRMPSYTLPSRPGPSSATSGRPVETTGSPGLMPDVSSYTWMIVLFPTILMTSPMSFSWPTWMTSYIFGEMPVAVTTGPATL